MEVYDRVELLEAFGRRKVAQLLLLKYKSFQISV
jgi:hypothetical protein